MLKKISLLTVLTLSATSVFAGNKIDIYYVDTCPHCHHALEFIEGDLKKEFQFDLNKIDMRKQENLEKFNETAKKCNLKSRGVPVMVINDQCLQGFAEQLKPVIKSKLNKDETKTASETATTNETANQEPVVELEIKEDAKTPNRLSILNKMILFCAGFGLGYLGIYFFRRKKSKKSKK